MRRRLHRFTNADTICVGKTDKLILEKVGELFQQAKMPLISGVQGYTRVHALYEPGVFIFYGFVFLLLR